MQQNFDCWREDQMVKNHDSDEWDDDFKRSKKKKTLRDHHKNGNHKVAFYELTPQQELEIVNETEKRHRSNRSRR